MNRHRDRFASGQTILELVVALGVVSLVLTGLVAAATSSLRFGQAGRQRGLGVKYAQEGIELSRKLRDGGLWSDFVAKSGSGTARWCLSGSGVWSQDTDVGCPIATENPFWRTVTFSWADPIMEITSEVSWGERQVPTVVTFVTQFTQWK